VTKIVLAGNALVASVLAGNLSCLSRWGTRLPAWVCSLAGKRSPRQVRSLAAVGAGAVLAVVLLSLAGIVYEWRRSGLSFRDWLDSLR
jgi:hypothetical protein